MKEPAQSKPRGLGTEAVKVADLVHYQDGSTVSREIVKKPTGTVTVFAFDAEQGLSEHTVRSMRSCMCSKARRKSASLASRIVCRAAR